jgi:hypothetical protein
MAAKILDDMEAFSRGADLWVVTDREHSSWAITLDWYLNFQIARVDAWKHKTLSKELIDLAEQAEVEIIKSPFSDHLPATLIESCRLLPNRQVLYVPYKKDSTAWFEQIEEIWSGLKKPTLRMFLPKGVSAEKVSNSKLEILNHASLVADTEPHP